jgi:hypothetical protein
LVGLDSGFRGLGGARPRWGPRRLRHDLGKRGVRPLPGRATIYRILTRNNLCGSGRSLNEERRYYSLG